MDPARGSIRRATATAMFVAAWLIPAAARGEDATVHVAGREVVLDAPRLRAAEGDVHAVVAFRRIPGASDREALDALGVRLHDYLPDHAYIATVPAGAAEGLLTLECVRGAEPVRPEWKGPPGIVDAPQRHLWNLPGGRLLAHVYFHPDVSEGEARSVLARVEAAPLHAGFGVRRRVRCEGSAETFRLLLAEDAVAWVETGRRVRRAVNAVAASVHGADEVGGSPFGLDGTGSRVGIMDADSAQAGHPEFGGRVTLVENYSGTADFHATHVTGTILGSGSLDADARGMAPGAKSWNWTFEQGDPVDKKASGFAQYAIDVDNNSWGSTGGWLPTGSGWLWFGTSGFGAYTAEVGDLDGVAADSGTLVLFAAGNDGLDDGYDGYGTTYYCYYTYYGYYCGWYTGHYDIDPDSGNYSFHTGYHAPDGGVDGLGNIGPESAMKNGICVAAMDASGDIADFSSAGPAKDGRMKPDCAAVGVGVWSTAPGSSHGSSDGTSMATPVVTGIAALIVEAWGVSHDGAKPPLDVLKGLLLHACVDLGTAGPDYRFGFGAPWAPWAAALALNEDGTSAPHLRQGSVSNGQTRTWHVEVGPSSGPLWVTLCWVDPPGSPSAQKALVNDLDLELVAPGGATTLPWKLNPSQPRNAATRGVNTLDTVERAEVSSPAEGNWRVRVRGGTVSQGTQAFAVWFSHPRANLLPEADLGADRTVSATSPTGATVVLSGAASSDPDEDDALTAYAWDLDDDGQFDDAVGITASRFFAMGEHEVALRVTDSWGGTSTDTMLVTVVNDPPTADAGGDRIVRANDPEGATVVLTTGSSADPQGSPDIVAAEWDLDGDGEYDDATGASVERRFPPGESEIGLRLRDTSGLEDVDRALLTVLMPERFMRLGGSLKGTLDHSGGEDRDSVFLEAVEGSTLDLKVVGRFPYRITVWRPSGGKVYDHPWSAADGNLTVKRLALTETGWYWLEIGPEGSNITATYSLKFSVRPPSGKFSLQGSLPPTLFAKEHPVALLAGSKISAVLRSSGLSLELVDPDGAVLTVAASTGKLAAVTVPETGAYLLRVAGPGGAQFSYDLLWKVKPPKEKVRAKE